MKSSQSDFAEIEPYSASAIRMLWGITILGAVLRIFYLHDRNPVGDELGTLTHIQNSTTYLLSHFQLWLTMNYYLVLEKWVTDFLGVGPLSLGLISLVSGIAAIPLSAALGRLIASVRVGLLTALLVAANPFLIEFSGVARSYSLTVALALLVLIAFYRWRKNRVLRRGASLALACYLLILSHPNGAYLVVSVVVIACCDLVRLYRSDDFWSSTRSIVFPLVLSLALTTASYAAVYSEMMELRSKFHGSPPTSIAYLSDLWSQQFSAGALGLPSLALLTIGVLVSIGQRRPQALLLVTALGPVALMSIQGTEYRASSYARYLIYLVPIVTVLIATGLHAIAERAVSVGRRPLAVGALTGLLLLTWFPNLLAVFDEKQSAQRAQDKHPWEAVANFIDARANPGDTVLGGGPFGPTLQLKPFLVEPTLANMTLPAFLNNYEFDGVSGRQLFYVSTASYRTELEQRRFGSRSVTVYPYASKNSVLGLIFGDLVNTVESEPSFRTLKACYSALCSLHRFLEPGTQDRPYCKLLLEIGETPNTRRAR